MAVKTMFGKTYLLLLTIFVGVMICFGLLIYQNTAKTMKKQLGNQCIGIASAVSVLIETDIEGFKEFSKSLDMESDYYKTIQPKLNRIRYDNAGNIAYLYVEARVSDSIIMYLLDGQNESDPFFSPPGYTDRITASEMEAYRTEKPSIPDEFVTNDYGTLLTCYVPIHDPSTGEFLALAGVDVSIDQYHAVMQNQLLTIVLSIAMLILLLFLALVLSSGRMEKLIVRDNLTGVYNKSHFMRRLRQQMKQSKRSGKPVAVFMADLDHFKKVNDKYGHIFGDLVLKAVSSSILGVLRKTDCFARYGGEEFSAFLPGTEIEAAKEVVERARLAVENTKIYNEEHQKHVEITVSIGIAQLEPYHSAQDILTLADKALYKAKITRNATALYSEEFEK